MEMTDSTQRIMEKGKFEVVHIGGLTVGRATYEPGWRWSEHVGPTVGASRCTVAHVGLVISGTATRRWRTDGCLSFGRASFSPYPRSRTIAGWWERAVCLVTLSWRRPLCYVSARWFVAGAYGRRHP